jgi:hypothetical protein
MKQFLIAAILIAFFQTTSFSQDFDSALEKLAESTASKISAKGKKKIAIWGFFEANSQQSALGNYITEDFSVYITNFGNNFEIIDRNHLDLLLKEHKLNAEGFIDENTAKEIGKITAADAIVTGTYSLLGKDKVKIRVKVLDTESALQFAASMGLLPLSNALQDIAGTKYDTGGTKSKISSSSKCQEETKGDLCFNNLSNEKMVVRISHFKYLDSSKNSRLYETIFVDPNETKCVYGMYSRPIDYYIATWSVFQKELEGNDVRLNSAYYTKFLKDKGQIKVETCQEKTFVIK